MRDPYEEVTTRQMREDRRMFAWAMYGYEPRYYMGRKRFKRKRWT